MAAAPTVRSFKRTFHTVFPTSGRRSIFQTARMCELFIDVMRTNVEKGRMDIHAFVIMQDHIHLLITPSDRESLEKCIQYLKGGFSYRAKAELGFTGEIWVKGFNETRIHCQKQFESVRAYIENNPVSAGKVSEPTEHNYSSALQQGWLSPAKPFRG